MTCMSRLCRLEDSISMKCCEFNKEETFMICENKDAKI